MLILLLYYPQSILIIMFFLIIHDSAFHNYSISNYNFINRVLKNVSFLSFINDDNIYSYLFPCRVVDVVDAVADAADHCDDDDAKAALIPVRLY